jgi:acyl-CoA synthetase (AMP-forming)/AMP-acid ligase II
MTRSRLPLRLGVIALMILSIQMSGCSLFVMAGKFLMGDPVAESQFKQRTGVDLRKDKKKVVVVCSVPEMLRQENASIDHDLVESIVRRFRVRDIETIPPRDVDRWLSSLGGVWNSPQEIAQKFEANYIIHVDLESVTYREPNSPNMYRGNCLGNVYVYEIRGEKKDKNAFLVFQHEFSSTYPQLHPVSVDQSSMRSFQEKYITRVSDELARLFYDFKMTEEVY